MPHYVAIAAQSALWSGLCLDHARIAGVGRRCIVSTHGQRWFAGLARRCPRGVFAELAGIHRSGFPAPCSCCYCKSPRCLPFHHISVLAYYSMPRRRKSTILLSGNLDGQPHPLKDCTRRNAKYALHILQSMLYFFRNTRDVRGRIG